MVFVCLTQLKKAANHSVNLAPGDDDEDDDGGRQRRQVRFWNHVFDGKPPNSREVQEMYLDFDHSGKLKIVDKLVHVWKKRGDKALIFSHSVKMLNIIERYVQQNGFDYCRLDGSTNPEKRLELVDEFNLTPSKFIFLISTKAGGIGLNLTCEFLLSFLFFSFSFLVDFLNPSLEQRRIESSYLTQISTRHMIFRLRTGYFALASSDK